MADTYKESFQAAGQQLVDAVRKLLHEGNVRRVVIKHGGETLAEFPLTMGVVGVALAPVVAAVAAIAAAVNECTVEVERDERSDKRGAA